MTSAESYSTVIADLLTSDIDTAIALWDVVTRHDDLPFVMDVHARLGAMGSLDPLVEALSKKAGPRLGKDDLTEQQTHDLWSNKTMKG